MKNIVKSSMYTRAYRVHVAMSHHSLHVGGRWVDCSSMTVVSINNFLLFQRRQIDARLDHWCCEPTQTECNAYHQMEAMHHTVV